MVIDANYAFEHKKYLMCLLHYPKRNQKNKDFLVRLSKL